MGEKVADREYLEAEERGVGDCLERIYEHGIDFVSRWDEQGDSAVEW